MTRRFGVALAAALGLACASFAAIVPAAAEGGPNDRPEYRHQPGHWEGHGWHPWQGETWRPYWRPYVYSTPYTYGYRYDDQSDDCRWVRRKEMWTDDHGREHWSWRKVEVCD